MMMIMMITFSNYCDDEEWGKGISHKIQNKEFPCVHETANVGKGKVAKIWLHHFTGIIVKTNIVFLTVLNQARLGSTTSGSSTPCSSTNQILKLKLGPCDMIGTTT